MIEEQEMENVVIENQLGKFKADESFFFQFVNLKLYEQ